MDPIPGFRAAILLAGGFALGIGATFIVDAFGGNPLLASLVIALGAIGVGVWVRRCEFLNLAVEGALYAYSSFLGLVLIREGSLETRLAQSLHTDPSTVFLTPVVLLAGVGFTAVMVFFVALPAWMIAARLSERVPEDAEKFWTFVESHIER